VNKLLSPAVSRGDLWILNYNRIVFGPDPAGTARDVLPDRPQSGMGRISSSSFIYPQPPPRLGTQLTERIYSRTANSVESALLAASRYENVT